MTDMIDDTNKSTFHIIKRTQCEHKPFRLKASYLLFSTINWLNIHNNVSYMINPDVSISLCNFASYIYLYESYMSWYITYFFNQIMFFIF